MFTPTSSDTSVSSSGSFKTCDLLSNLAKFSETQVLKLPDDNTEVSKHVGVNIIQRENTMIYICILVGFNKTELSVFEKCVPAMVPEINNLKHHL